MGLSIKVSCLCDRCGEERVYDSTDLLDYYGYASEYNVHNEHGWKTATDPFSDFKMYLCPDCLRKFEVVERNNRESFRKFFNTKE